MAEVTCTTTKTLLATLTAETVFQGIKGSVGISTDDGATYQRLKPGDKFQLGSGITVHHIAGSGNFPCVFSHMSVTG